MVKSGQLCRKGQVRVQECGHLGNQKGLLAPAPLRVSLSSEISTLLSCGYRRHLSRGSSRTCSGEKSHRGKQVLFCCFLKLLQLNVVNVPCLGRSIF